MLLSLCVLTLIVDWDQYFTVLIFQSLVVTLNSSENRTQGSRAHFVRMGNHSKRVNVRCALWMIRAVFHDIRLGPKTSVYHVKVIVVSTATGCDVTYCATTLQGFNKHASSRRGAVSDSRGVPRCTEKNSTNLRLLTCVDSSNSPYPYPVTRIVTRRHCTTCQVNSSRSALFPYQASISICGIVHVPAHSSRFHISLD